MFKRKTKVTNQTETVALCLGGGGARGFAHIGAIKAFNEAGVTFDMVVGTSVGSLVGAMYAAGVSVETLIDYAEKLSFKDLHNGIFVTPNDPMKIAKIVTDLVGDINIQNLKMKYAAVAADLVEAEQVILDSGNLAMAVASSCCVPILYKPIIYGRRHLCDGGLLNNIPADVCRMLGATKVVTVDVHPSRGSGSGGVGLIDVIKTTLGIMISNSSVDGLRHSDVIISPDTSEFSSMSKNGWQKMIELGYESTKQSLFVGRLRGIVKTENN